MRTIILSLFLLLSISSSAQDQFVTAEAKFVYNLAKTKGAEYFDKNFETDFKKQGYTLDDDMIFINVGEALKEEKKIDESISVFKVGTKTWPNIIMLWNGLGEAYLLKENKAEAKKCFEKVLKLRPENPRAKEGLKKAS